MWPHPPGLGLLSCHPRGGGTGWRGHPGRQCARCFLFLCFLSFFLLLHLEQNHCDSSGGAAISPTQDLRVQRKIWDERVISFSML